MMNEFQKYVFEYEQLVGRRFTITEAKEIYFKYISECGHIVTSEHIQSWNKIENKFIESHEKFN